MVTKRIFIVFLLISNLILLGCTYIPNEEKTDFKILKLKDLIYEDFNNGPKQEAYKYRISDEWISIVENHPYFSYDQPHLSWKVAEVLEGLNYSYKATGDELFLNSALEMYDALLKRRDDSEKRYSWDGKIYKLWGSTSRYNGARKTLYNENGIAIATLFFYGPNHDQTSISIAANNNHTFNIIIKHQNDEYYLKGLTMDTISKRLDNEIDWKYYGSPLKNKNVIQTYVDENYFDSLPVPIENSMLENIVVPNALHTGLILENMASTYIELKKINHPQTERYKIELKTMIDEVLETTWIEVSKHEGFFASPKNSPTYLGGGKILPWNQQFPIIEAIAIYAREEEDTRMEKIVVQFSNVFIKNVEKTSEGYLWKYWEEETGTIGWYESTNYGGMDASSIYTIYETGIAFKEDDIKMISQTLSNNIIGYNSKVSSKIDGAGKRQENVSLLFRYLPYSIDVPSIKLLLSEEEMNWMQAAKFLYYYDKEIKCQRGD